MLTTTGSFQRLFTLPQFDAADFATDGLGQFRDEFDSILNSAALRPFPGATKPVSVDIQPHNSFRSGFREGHRLLSPSAAKIQHASAPNLREEVGVNAK